MRSALAVSACLFLAAVWPPGLRADSIFEYRIHLETVSPFFEPRASDFRTTIYVGEGRARSDSGSTSYILRTDLGKLWVVFHQRKKYWEFDTPVQVKNLVPDESRPLLAEGQRMGAALVEISATDDRKTHGGWQAKRWKIEVVQPLLHVSRTIDLWLHTDPEIHLAPYQELRKGVSALGILDEEWTTEILNLEGLKILADERTEFGKRTEHSTTTLVSHREEDMAEVYYSIPDGYAREAFDLGLVLGHEEPSERPGP